MSPGRDRSASQCCDSSCRCRTYASERVEPRDAAVVPPELERWPATLAKDLQDLALAVRLTLVGPLITSWSPGVA